jgi:hypothetical protein
MPWLHYRSHRSKYIAFRPPRGMGFRRVPRAPYRFGSVPGDSRAFRCLSSRNDRRRARRSYQLAGLAFPVRNSDWRRYKTLTYNRPKPCPKSKLSKPEGQSAEYSRSGCSLFSPPFLEWVASTITAPALRLSTPTRPSATIMATVSTGQLHTLDMCVVDRLDTAGDTVDPLHGRGGAARRSPPTELRQPIS